MQKTLLALAAFLLTVAAVALLLVPPLHAETTPTLLGVWRATLDGVPSVTLTLADDTGSLNGTVVFYSVNGETKRAMSIEPHTLLHPQLTGDTLSFQIRRPDARLISFTVRFTTAATGQIHCTDCGEDAPTADLAKDTVAAL